MDASSLIDSFLDAIADLEGGDRHKAALIVMCYCVSVLGLAVKPERAELAATILSTCVRDVLLASIVEQPEQKTNIVPFTRRS